MRLQLLLFFILFSLSFTSVSQEMQEGFTYLETGKYAKAEVFFKEILKEFPTNKTARLCYGRAVGLSGNSNKALNLFTSLLKDFPTDFEVKLNYAEALLWDKKYNEAKEFYQKLVQEDAQSFPALLGYANTLSNLKEFESALIYVDKALEVLPGNANALVSKKYMRLGLASTKVTDLKYGEAEAILKENFESFENDKETLLNLANLYLISNQTEKAKETYKTIGLNPENQFTSLNGIALAFHLAEDDKLALETSESAMALLTDKTDADSIKQTKERYIQALIWNKKYKLAKNEIDTLFSETEVPENWMYSLRATLNVYKSDFKKSVADYNLILEKDSASFDGNLGKANVLKALGYYKEAYKSAENTLSFYEKQKDASNFIISLDKVFTPYVEATTSYSFDNGDNEANSYIATANVPLSIRLAVFGAYNFRETSNTINNLKATTNIASFGLSYQLLNNVVFRGSLGTIKSESDAAVYNQLLIESSLRIKPFKLQNLELGFRREVQNFNAELLDREIVMNNYILNYSLSTNFKLGWFSQYYFTDQSDANQRNLLFTSLYYNILAKPSLKAGVNYQYITFKDQVPTIYFSPSNFNAVEVFFNIIKTEGEAKNKALFYDLTAATGFQYIEDNERLSTYRIQGKLGYRFSERSIINLYGLQSNIASATAAGFTFTEFGLRFQWFFLKSPIYKRKD
tara:strand:+ start:424 stop:2493 length:2070 start_codon:yes stop_codon:yes gene_type:complete